MWPGFEFKKKLNEKKKSKSNPYDVIDSALARSGFLKKYLRQKNSDSASTNVAQLRDQKESKFSFQAGFRESQIKAIENDTIGQKGVGRFSVILLQEGLGNLNDAFYYTKEALESAVEIFEGKKIYADHPSKTEEQDRPERTVRDVLGHFENVKVVEQEDDNHMRLGRMELAGDVVPIAGFQYGWIKDIFGHAVAFSKKYKEKAFIGLSINAMGDSEEVPAEDIYRSVRVPQVARPKIEEAKSIGVSTIRVVRKITDAVSCDLVTEAGAGGRVIDILEGDKMAKKMKKREADGLGAPPEDGQGAAGAGKQPAHDDASQDKELIKSMIAKHLGDGSEEGTMETALAMHQAYSEMGYNKDKACEYAAHSAKMAGHVAKKKHETESEESESEETTESEETKEESLAIADDGDKKESQKPNEEVTKLLAKNAALASRIDDLERDRVLERSLSESNLPESAQKLFRESVEKVKNAEDIKKQFKLFSEAYKHAKESKSDGLTTEKVTLAGDDTVSFADCVRN